MVLGTDFVIEGKPHQGGRGGGGLSGNQSWYRKEFEVPASAQGKLVWLTFDGVFRDAVVYLNGEKVKHHVEGYTSWTAYLHNASAPLKYGAGGRNVLAVFVDATQAELWCYVSP